MHQVLALAITLAICASATPTASWLLLKKSPSTAIVEFSVALYEQNLDLLEEIALNVSDPK